MDDAMQQRIAHRAREIWEMSGRPEGRDEEFWLKAEQEVRGEAETYEKISADPTVETNS
ncbi:MULTISPECIES: DUF2934 domain-containing protein [Rhodopseudomonas]|uniref:DUF2934 domain-containing protein n=1 Tax=Rhodopseudomonas TaxID=1073 RepID=UPI0009BADA91|nr:MULTISPECIES: DUF2934 domain-containing protein [Rhodopseudomonas]MDF3812641.1 DUF2934 domain-containing protein [Rhodopseudomonas sp. BAL398]WOK17386.1 DUF2934 domain-containing protein [Rhodopseudomonas sp. BAL398]